jgi:hypothetical protein
MTKGITNADRLRQHFDKCMHILRTAALAVEDLRSKGGPCKAIAKCLKTHLVAARKALNARLHECGKQQVSSALLPTLDFTSEREKLCPFQLQLRAQSAPLPQDSSSIWEKSIHALGGVPRPPVLGKTPAAWCQWLQDHMNSRSQSWSTITLLLQQVEQHFFMCRELYLGRSALMRTSSKTRLNQHSLRPKLNFCRNLAAYSKVVVQAEAWPGLWQYQRDCPDMSDYANAPMLKVQLRSMEALLTWIVLCLIYLRVETDEWEGIRKYKLPVEPDDLRHLVCGGNAAVQHAVMVVLSTSAGLKNAAMGKHASPWKLRTLSYAPRNSSAIRLFTVKL